MLLRLFLEPLGIIVQSGGDLWCYVNRYGDAISWP